MDNCTAQNKNWILFTAMVDIINSGQLAAKTITFKFLEAGHTFMSADSIHHDVEQRMRKKINIYDFNDFVACVEARNIKVTTLPCTGFKALKGQQSHPKLSRRPCLLSEIRVVQFRQGETSMFVKQRHTDRNYTTFDFLKKKFVPGTSNVQSIRDVDRGIPEAKKADIISNLLPLMPTNRTGFWRSLRVSDVPDLITASQTD